MTSRRILQRVRVYLYLYLHLHTCTSTCSCGSYSLYEFDTRAYTTIYRLLGHADNEWGGGGVPGPRPTVPASGHIFIVRVPNVRLCQGRRVTFGA